MQIFINKDYH